jgi:DNA gyrase/topoisomerase IV subunit B
MAKPQSANDDRSSKYRRLTQVEHVAHRAAMYLGSTSVEQTMQWVATRESDTIIVACKEISFVPALYKLYDEVVTLRQRTTR